MTDKEEALKQGYKEGFQIAIEIACAMIENERLKVLESPDDPSWTEHFAELQNKLRAVPNN